ncbi:hypothetical protein [Rhizobium sp. SAFR-030]|uniref:hypothetical protein n=1 Tax=Rhizobium sp. SAFR-030 TaxID=3387277 RepID=UPI003F81325A
MKKKTPEKRGRNELVCIAIGKYYDALDHYKYAGTDADPPSVWHRERAVKYEATMRAAVQEFERTYGKPKRSDELPIYIWECCRQQKNVREFDGAWTAAQLAGSQLKPHEAQPLQVQNFTPSVR